MVLLIYFQKINDASFHATIFTLSNLHKKLSTMLFSTFFISDIPLPDNKKIDKELIDMFL